MKRVIALSVAALMSVSLLVVPAVSAMAAPAESPTLWLTATRANGDGTNTFITYHTDLNGNLVQTPFATPNTAISSIAVDPKDRTLWGANEGSASGTPPGKLVNYDRSGMVLTEIPAGLFGGVGTEGLALTVSPNDDTLWVVDDPAGPTTQPNVYHVRRNGDLIASFSTEVFDSNAQSPQSIAYDAYSATLWIADNSTEKVYNIAQDGTLLSSFATNSAVFAAAGGAVNNVQGISVESSEVLWLTARERDRVYRVSKAGDVVLSSFAITDVEGGSFDPTGVAFDRPPGNVGAAASFGILGLPGARLQMKNVDKWTGVVGDVGLAAGAEQDFDEGLITGSYVVDPDADDANSNDVVISGGSTTADLSLAVSDAEYASLAASALTPTHVFGEIKSSTQVVGGSGLTVVDAEKIELDGEETLTLVGDATSIFVLNLDEKLKLKNRSAIVLQGGVTAENVFFNILGTDDSSIEGESFVAGTIIAPDAKLKIKNQGSVVVGRMFSGVEVKLEDGGRLRLPSLQLYAGALGAADDAAVLALPHAKVKIDDAGSAITGDVVLGPFAEQDFSEGTINGVLVVDPAADNDHDNDVVITGGIVTAQTSQAVADAVDASYVMARLPADQVFGDIKDDAVIAVGGGLSVVFAEKIELDGDETLTITGPASARVVVNVDERFKLKDNSAVVSSGGLSAANVIFNVLDSSDAAVESGSASAGTVLAPWASKLKVKESGSAVTGALIGGGDIIVEKAGAVIAS